MFVVVVDIFVATRLKHTVVLDKNKVVLPLQVSILGIITIHFENIFCFFHELFCDLYVFIVCYIYIDLYVCIILSAFVITLVFIMFRANSLIKLTVFWY